MCIFPTWLNFVNLSFFFCPLKVAKTLFRFPMNYPPFHLAAFSCWSHSIECLEGGTVDIYDFGLYSNPATTCVHGVTHLEKLFTSFVYFTTLLCSGTTGDSRLPQPGETDEFSMATSNMFVPHSYVYLADSNQPLAASSAASPCGRANV